MTVKEFLKILPPGSLDLPIEIHIGGCDYQPLSHAKKVTDKDGVEALLLTPECYVYE